MTNAYIHSEHSLLAYIHFWKDGFSCKICPNLGGSLQELIIDNVKIIDGISFDEKGIDQYKETYCSAILFPFANRVERGRYSFEGHTYQLPLNEPNLNNALHGLVYNQAFEVKALHTNQVTLFLCYGGSEGYPFPFELILTYIIGDDGLALHYEVINTGDCNMPFSFGWHPYFWLPDKEQAYVFFDGTLMMMKDKHNIFTGWTEGVDKPLCLKTRHWDDGFLLNTTNVVYHTANYSIEMKAEHHPFLQIYTPLEGHSVAIEPMTGAVNAFNNRQGLQVLTPNDRYKGQITLDYKRRDGIKHE